MQKTVRVNSLQAWLLATRPKTMVAAIIPVLVAVSLAWADGYFQTVPAILCFLFACGMQIAANFINDLYDYRKGTDREDRLGPERACAQGWITPKAMSVGIAVVVGFSCIAGLGILLGSWEKLPYHGWELITIGVMCVVFAFFYTTFLSYHGWGDVLVLVFFGFVPVCGTYYVQTCTLTIDTLVASLICGLLIDTLLVINNYRDREQDALSGKQTIIVCLGESFGRYFYLGLGVATTVLSLWLARNGGVVCFLLPFLYLAVHVCTWKRMCRINRGKKLNSILAETSRNMLFMGLLLVLIILL